jgi:hypothetical protein
MTASDFMRDIGRGIGAEWNTITTGITIETETTMITTGMVTTIGTAITITTTRNSGNFSWQPEADFGECSSF